MVYPRFLLTGWRIWARAAAVFGGGGGPELSGTRQVIPPGIASTSQGMVYREPCPGFPVACLVAITVMVLIGLVLTWLSSRGQFMFLHCVAKNKAEVSIPWTKIRPARQQPVSVSHRLWADFLCDRGSVYAGRGGVGGSMPSPTGEDPGLKQINPSMIISLVVGISRADNAVYCTGSDKYIHAGFCGADHVFADAKLRGRMARVFGDRVRPKRRPFSLSPLSDCHRHGRQSALVLAFALVTCGCACCFLAIPYIGTVVALPLLVFNRAYSLHYLRQFGSDFDVFIPEPEDIPVPVIVV